MTVAVDNVAKISLTLDTVNIFKQIENIQEKLNKLSVKNIKASRGEEAFNGIVKSATKAKEQIMTLEKALKQAEQAYSQAYYKNNTNVKWAMSDEAKKLVDEIKKAQIALNDFKNLKKAINEEITGDKAGSVQNKDWERQQKEALAKQKKEALAQKQLQRDVDKAYSDMLKSEKSKASQAVKIRNAELKEKDRLDKEAQKAQAQLLKEQVKQAREYAQQEAKIYKDLQKQKLAAQKAQEKKELAEKKKAQKQLQNEVNKAYKQMVASEKDKANTELKKIIQQDKLDSRSYAQQIRDLRKEIASKYAKGGKYLESGSSLFSDNKSQFERDLETLDNLIIKYNRFKNDIQKGNLSRDRYVDELPSYQAEINNRRKEMQAKMRNMANYISSDDYKQDIAQIQKLQKEYNQLKADIKGVSEKKQEVNVTKIKTDDIDNYSKRIRQLRNELEKRALNDSNFVGSEDYKNKVTNLKNMQTAYNRLKSDIRLAKEESKGFKSYQTEMARVEREAARVYHEFVNTSRSDSNYNELRKQLKDLANEYQKLNKESVNFRKNIGISSSRGFYDLNSSYDYFLAKFRSKVTAGIAGIVEGYAMNVIPNFVDTMAKYQQNRTNFAQVLPDNVANDQKAMNQAMRDFSSIASDYGASIQEVTEAGRLWGRQYKDVAVIQELVRNSTKLSITDDMSLIEVNKGLEATMQQYNIHLKDANEAQAVSGKVVDTWAKLADNAVVTASDLAKANEQSAGAAYQAGVSFDYLNSMIATMSSATGKAGAEIGRSIRSMLVSMTSNKAQKYFQQLGISTKEIGTDGVMHVRSYEKVIDELMKKLKSNPKDVSNVVLAMSGGKYQYNNVMALLKNYDNLQKNLQTVRSSSGWADEQVALQYQTISRQLKALTADFQQMIITLDQAGASAGISNLIQQARYIVQVLSSIKPENIQALMSTVEGFVKLAVVLKGLSVLVTVTTRMKALLLIMRALPSVLTSTARGITSISTALGLLQRSLGWIGLLLTLGQVLFTVGEAIYDFDQKASFDNIKKQTQQLGSTINSLTEEAKMVANVGVDNIEKYASVMSSANDIIRNSTSTQQEKEKANKTLSNSEQALTSLIGAEAVERLKASNFSQEAVSKEISIYQQMQITSNAMLQQRIKDEISTTDAVIENVTTRINAYQKEMEYYSKIAQVKFQTYKSAYDNYEKNWASKEDSFAKQMATRDLNKAQSEYKEAQTKASEFIYMQGETRKILSDLTTNRARYSNLANGKITEPANKANITSSNGGIVDEAISSGKKGSKGKTGSGSTKDYTEQKERNDLIIQRNKLWYEGSIQAKQYENALKTVTNNEQYYGSTVASIIKKSSLYTERSKQLEGYQKKLETFRQSLQNELDKKMQANPQLMASLNYQVGMKAEELNKNIEVNKELYQQEKTVSTIVNMISSVNQKLEDTKSKQIDVVNNLRKINEEISKQKISDIEQQASIDLARVNRPLNYGKDKQQNEINLEAEKSKLKERIKQYQEAEQDLLIKIQQGKEQFIQEAEQLRNKRLQIVEETKAKIAQLEYEKNLDIRQGLYDVTQQFLIQGNTLRDIWNNLWKDLAREALQKLFRIQAQASILGSLFGWSTKSVTSTVSASNYNFGNSFGYSDFKLSHTGENLTGYPKMHTGGMVAKGRLGVVPKLKSDEVIRTLQIGEEVNSVSDRRSNEILATVAMKAIDSRSQQPNNINIMALDAKSFAEYLNDNADILLAVLNKQGALGRR